VERRRNAEALDWALFEGEEEGRGERREERGEGGTAVDPICGMTVDIVTAQYIYEHEGQIYYFCCGGCQSTFAKSKVT
jgi:YHS domain-containing protein